MGDEKSASMDFVDSVCLFIFKMELDYFAHSVSQAFCADGDPGGDWALGLGRGDFIWNGLQGQAAVLFPEPGTRN